MLMGIPHHIGLTASDLDVSVAFYDRVLAELGYT